MSHIESEGDIDYRGQRPTHLIDTPPTSPLDDFQGIPWDSDPKLVLATPHLSRTTLALSAHWEREQNGRGRKKLPTYRTINGTMVKKGMLKSKRVRGGMWSLYRSVIHLSLQVFIKRLRKDPVRISWFNFTGQKQRSPVRFFMSRWENTGNLLHIWTLEQTN